MALSPETLQHEMQELAAQRVLTASKWLTATQVADLSQHPHAEAEDIVVRWKRDHLIFSITVEGTDRYPDYALDSLNAYSPRPELQSILTVFHAIAGGWRLAFWFNSPNSYLDGRRPRECYWLIPTQTLFAAQMEVSGPLHG